MTKLVFLSILALSVYAQDIIKAKESVSLKNSALVLIEYQNEWLSEESKLSKLMQDKEQFNNSIINSKKALAHARKLGIKVIHVPLIVSEDYREFGTSAKYGLRAVIPEVKTWQGKSKDFHKDFIPFKDEFIVKGRVGASGFAGSNLDSILRNNGIDTLFLTGYATNVCVESTMREAHDKGYNTIVISDATSAFTKEQKDFFLKEIVHHYGQSISTEIFLNSVIHEDNSTILASYYDALAKEDIEKALSFISNDIHYLAVKDKSEKYPSLYGMYKGHNGVKEFFKHLQEYYEIKDFDVQSIGSNKNEAFAKGHLEYIIKKNGKKFSSDWMAFAKIKNGKISEYQFFKDTANLETQYGIED